MINKLIIKRGLEILRKLEILKDLLSKKELRGNKVNLKRELVV